MLTATLLAALLAGQAPSSTPIADAIPSIDVRTIERQDAASPRPPHRDHGYGFKLLMVGNVVVMGADMAGTMTCIAERTCVEVNLLQKHLVENRPILAGAVNGLQTAAILLWMDRVSQKRPKLANAIMAFWLVTRGYVAFVNNKRVLEQGRGR